MVIGSEGILGVITEAWMRLQERPNFRASCPVFFNDYDKALKATRYNPNLLYFLPIADA
ncbi:MAG: hypothetical protein Ct9H300mP3_05200 [Gammaproteobacteria bacterium]|nr:MAG: hypothetical protein Ct9H300mP3_05200 [Gammaproteobacteria bacterium]